MSDYMHKEYKLPNGRTVTVDFNDLGCAMVTIQAMDALFDILNSSVDVVRCKECKHKYIIQAKDRFYKVTNRYYACDHMNGKYEENNFCSFGERADT